MFRLIFLVMPGALRSNSGICWIGLFILSIPAPVAQAGDPISYERVRPIFQKNCQGCHGPDRSKGDLRIDRLNPDFVGSKDRERWLEVLNRLNFGDMPPQKESKLTKEERDLLTQWLTQERRRADLARNEATHFRRLTRREYERTMQDLLGLLLEFGTKLPEDGRSKDGFRNNGDVLRMSPLQYETYLQIADEALAEAIVSGPPPVVHRYRLSGGPKQNIQVTVLPRPADRPGESFDYDQKEKKFRIWTLPGTGPDGTLLPSAIGKFEEAAVKMPEQCLAFGFHQAFRKGETRIRVAVARVEPASQGRIEPARKKEPGRSAEQEGGTDTPSWPSLTVALGSTNFHGVELKILGDPVVVDHLETRTYDFRVRMENIANPNTGPLNDKNATVVVAWNSAPMVTDKARAPRLKIEWIEFETPFLETWPPATHTNILFDRKGLPEPEYAREVLRRFCTCAYRGPITPEELDQHLQYWNKARASCDTLEESLRETLSVVLSSPRFLGLPTKRATGAREPLTDHELATRMSYFLWSTMPDATLFHLAEQGKLRDPIVRNAQIRRMIQDPRAWELIEQFTEQWLELDRLQRVVVSKEHYRGVDDRLLAAMRLETIHFFGEVLRGDLSIFELLSARFTCLNETMANHYGIQGIKGPQFRKVKLEEGLHRGGILTQASVLTGLSDGRDGHPIKRGVWLLRNLLDEPPPPPPPNVPELNRESPQLKNLTIPQALAVHRSSTACVGCHARIDPWGIAFEEYDAVGNWQRDGKGANLRKKRTNQPIESQIDLPSGVKVGGMEDLRAELLRSKSDQFRQALVRKLMAFALGRSLTLGDVETADSLAVALRAREDRLPALIELIIGSEPFQSR